MPIKLRPFWIHSPKPFVAYTKAVVHPQVLKDAARFGLSRFLGQYLGLIHGKSTLGDTNPYPAIAKGSGLMRPKAIFSGLKRKIGKSRTGSDVFCYVTNPLSDYDLDVDHAIENEGEPESERLRLVEFPAPDDSVLVTFLLTNASTLDEVRPLIHDSLVEVQAVVIGWEWTLAMPDGSGLPFDHPTRYESRIL